MCKFAKLRNYPDCRPPSNEWVKLSTLPESGGSCGHAYSGAWGLVMAGAGASDTAVFSTVDGINFDYREHGGDSLIEVK